jgi:hypothetical protein
MKLLGKFSISWQRNKPHTKSLLSAALLGLLVACSLTSKAGNINQLEKQQMTTSHLVQRGKQLRADIDTSYQKLVDTKTLKVQGQGVNLITDMVIKYIPIGTSFDDAKEILRAAGFTVEPPSKNPLYPDESDEYQVAASIDGYQTQLFFSKTSIDVYMYPQSPTNFGTIKRIKAYITKTTL